MKDENYVRDVLVKLYIEGWNHGHKAGRTFGGNPIEQHDARIWALYQSYMKLAKRFDLHVGKEWTDNPIVVKRLKKGKG